ncbi:uncharacterized protein J4E88_010833 [Alternaria novae-zelandiae]|uniref:uncharacterized protein n=1 Tax=Alternaria novae-zelandiae TaxID=430562 RepID=UPI0020C2F7A8|nr:uncharacterized protein J4E88_010833 [Alternaria novae-zelandiae]KAI4663128.1 hypothetical protein J4E88_010833 [Alternaria novae-zelandiae]
MTSPNFWNRFGLHLEDRDICLKAVRDRYGDYEVDEYSEQGYCSFTLLVTPPKVAFARENTRPQATAEVECEDAPALIVQLRPPQHALDLNIVRAASTAHQALAPTIEDLDLTLPRGICAYEMRKVDGTPLSRLQQHGHSLDDRAAKRLERLITSFADLIAQNWHSPREVHDITRTVRADSPMDEHPSMLTQCRGKVGSTMISRLERLASELPDAYLRERARETMRAIQRMEDYPVVLNHGDLIPSNILVDHDTWEITGLVDWAEAEYLPFGTCLYGLEHLLGTISQDPAKSGPKWTYFNGATQLRELFWSRLIDAIPELEARMGDVRVMRDVGVLLWHGIAWDNGAIDRVVNDGEDVEELVKLRAFLTAG